MSFSRRRVLALLTLTTILLITFDLRGTAAVDSARGLMARVMEPLQDAGRAVARPVENAWNGITDYGEIKAENDRLREQVAQQEGDHIAAIVAVQEYQDLLETTRFDTDSSNVKAQVLEYSSQNFQQTVEINRGSLDGIRVGMAVASSAGLVGRVTQVPSDHRALVMLITDPQFSMAVKILDGENVVIPGSAGDPSATTTTTTTTVPTTTIDPALLAELPEGFSLGTGDDPAATTTTTLPPGATTTSAPPSTVVASTTTTTADLTSVTQRELGLLEGRGAGNRPIVGLLSSDRRNLRIEVGDVVATSGSCASLAPPNLSVGRVARVEDRAGSAGPLVEVEPAADVTNLNFVVVLLYLPATEVNGEICD